MSASIQGAVTQKQKNAYLIEEEIKQISQSIEDLTGRLRNHKDNLVGSEVVKVAQEGQNVTTLSNGFLETVLSQLRSIRVNVSDLHAIMNRIEGEF